MDEKQLLKLLLKVDNSFAFVINLKTLMISVAYYGDEDLCKNGEIHFKDFINVFFDKIGVQSEHDSNAFLKRIEDNIKDDSLYFPAVVKDENNKPIKLIFKGSKIDDEKYIVHVNKEVDPDFDKEDELTKCITKAKFIERLNSFVMNKDEFIMCLVDIDNFRNFNTKYGHVLGDIALMEFASKIKEIIGNDGYITRVSGDEFVFIYKIKDDYNTCHEFLETNKYLIEDAVEAVLDIDYRLTLTMGSAQSPSDGDNFDILFKKCQKALVRGKKKARNCFIMYLEEKCGHVNVEDEIMVKEFDENSYTNAKFSVITGILEIINSSNNFSKNIDECLNLIGTYFLLDRVTLIENNDEENHITNTKVWYNPKSVKKEIYTSDESIPSWRKELGQSNQIIYNDVYHEEQSSIQKDLLDGNVTAIVAIEIKIEGKIFGIIKYEMTSIARKWDPNDISSFILITKIFSIKYRKEYENHLHEKQLFHDKLTGFYNYTKWNDKVIDYIENNNIKEYTIVDMSIYELRYITSIIGQTNTDELLVYIARIIDDLAKGTKVIYCRSSEDTFTFFVPSHNIEGIIKVFNDFVPRISEYRYNKDAKVVFVAGSYKNETADEKLSVSVDRAVIAKSFASPANNFVEFEDYMLDEEKNNFELATHFEVAIRNDEFLLYLQPKISTKDGSLAGAEALTRWMYNGEKLLFPNQFIQMLEENGYIIKLDYVVFENVCKFLRQCLDEGLKVAPISVNVSRAVGNFDLYLENLEITRNKYNIPSNLLEIEITEGMYTENQEAIKNFINKVHEKGYSVSMDDFGSGYSNISSLSQLNFDTIKFDKSFFSDINNKKETLIISVISKLVKDLNMMVLCEGIETEDYAKYLKEVGCDVIQGYLYDRPLPSEDFKNKYLKKN